MYEEETPLNIFLIVNSMYFLLLGQLWTVMMKLSFHWRTDVQSFVHLAFQSSFVSYKVCQRGLWMKSTGATIKRIWRCGVRRKRGVLLLLFSAGGCSTPQRSKYIMWRTRWHGSAKLNVLSCSCLWRSLSRTRERSCVQNVKHLSIHKEKEKTSWLLCKLSRFTGHVSLHHIEPLMCFCPAAPC